MRTSISCISLTGATLASTPRDTAAALNETRNASIKVADGGLYIKVILPTLGAISFKSSAHLPPSDGTMGVKPVALPPGRGRLATKPLPTGSATNRKTIGMVWVCCSITRAVGVLVVTIKSG